MINKSFTIRNHTFQNRVVFQPMEGADCLPDGTPSEYTLRKYMRFASAGSGLIWFEANAVVPEGKANPRIYLACGEQDFGIESNRAMAKFLREQGADCTYREGPGVHDWSFWVPRADEAVKWLLGCEES